MNCISIYNEHVEIKIKNIILFIVMPKKMKFLCIHLTKHVLDLYAENYKM